MFTCGPLSFSDIGPPFFPVLGPFAIFLEPSFFFGQILVAVEDHHGERWERWVEERKLNRTSRRNAAGQAASKDKGK